MPHEIRDYAGDDIICRQGEAADRLYVLRRGQVLIRVNVGVAAPDDSQIRRDGVEVGRVAGDGELIGEGGVFRARRAASILAGPGGVTLEHIAIGADGLRRVLLERPALALKLCRSLAQRLKDVTERVRDLAVAAEAFGRHTEQLAMQFCELVRRAVQLAGESPGLLALAEGFTEHQIYLKGHAIEQQRRETAVFFNKAAQQRRAGAIRLETGEVLCQEGAVGRDLYLVREGRLEVVSAGSAIGVIGPDETAGEIAVLLKEAPMRTATLRASAPTALLCISGARFYELVETDAAPLVPIARSLTSRLDLTNRLFCRGGYALVGPSAGEGEVAGSEIFSAFADALSEWPEANDLCRKARSLAARAARADEELTRRLRAAEA